MLAYAIYGFRSAISEVRHSGGPLGLTLTLTLTLTTEWRTSGMADPWNGDVHANSVKRCCGTLLAITLHRRGNSKKHMMDSFCHRRRYRSSIMVNSFSFPHFFYISAGMPRHLLPPHGIPVIPVSIRLYGHDWVQQAAQINYRE